ncbi:MAG: YCF48-related protein [Vicinamibacterales bacterium]
MKDLLITGAAICAAVVVSAAPTWTAHLTGVAARLRGISAVSHRVAWASGTGGTVLRTTNGGDAWQTIAVPGAERLDFRDIDAFSDKTAYILSIGNGDASRIYRTNDGGTTWALQLANQDPKIFLDAMDFWSDDRGLAFSDAVDGRFVIFMTTNGGRTWTRLPDERLPPALPDEGAYAASGTNVTTFGKDHVWIGTTASRVLHSADRGMTWTVAQTPLPTSQSAGIFSVAFRDEIHGVVVGGDYQKEGEAVNNVALTSDGGRTWTLGKSLSGFRSVVAHRPGSKPHWIAVGPQGADVSMDDGRTWTPLPGAGFHTFSFARNGRAGWGAGERGAIARLEGF